LTRSIMSSGQVFTLALVPDIFTGRRLLVARLRTRLEMRRRAAVEGIIAIPGKYNSKNWRNRGRKRKPAAPDMPTIIEAKSSQDIKPTKALRTVLQYGVGQASAPGPVLRPGRQPVDRLGVYAKPLEKVRGHLTAGGPPVAHSPRPYGQAVG